MNRAGLKYAMLMASLAIFSAGPALAQAVDPSAATRLFSEGREAIKNGDLTAGCARFADSQRLDPKVGTLLNLAQCEEQLGQLLKARQHWLEAVSLAEQTSDARASVARERADTLGSRIPKLAVHLVDEKAPGLIIRLDGATLDANSLHAPVAVDPGQHTIEVTAPAHYGTAVVVSVGEREQREVSIGPGAKQLAPQERKPLHTSPVTITQPEPIPTRRFAAFALGGVALTAFGFGTALGIHAIVQNEASSEPCRNSNACSLEGLRLRDEAQTAATWSTISFAVGAGALTSAAVLWFVSSPKESRKARVAVRASSIQIEGQW